MPLPSQPFVRDGEDRDTHLLAAFHFPDVMELLNWM
mgnify:CR=1 FL=1